MTVPMTLTKMSGKLFHKGYVPPETADFECRKRYGTPSLGFTLIELLIVVLILGIVAVAAIPSMNSGFNEMKLDSAARETVSAIQYAQSLAIKEGDIYGVHFNSGSEIFNCYKTTPGTTITNPFNKKPYKVDFTAEGHLQGIDIVSSTFSAGNNFVYFNSLGEPNSSGTVTLAYGGLQKTINLSFPAGDLSVN